jgi:NADH dehydrogenase FAD-containing subunit
MNQIVIIGAGYGGMAAAMGLAGRIRGRDDVGSR